MTRKDYVTLAAAIKAARDAIKTADGQSVLSGSKYAAEFIADALSRDNPKFDRARFMRACGITE